ETFVRPHDVELRLEPDEGSVEAMVERVVHLGFEARVELVRDDGQHLLAQLTQEEAEQLELERGQIVSVRSSRETVFSAAARPPGARASSRPRRRAGSGRAPRASARAGCSRGTSAGSAATARSARP